MRRQRRSNFFSEGTNQKGKKGKKEKKRKKKLKI